MRFTAECSVSFEIFVLFSSYSFPFNNQLSYMNYMYQSKQVCEADLKKPIPLFRNQVLYKVGMLGTLAKEKFQS